MTTIAGIATGDSNFSILVAALGFIDTENGTNYVGLLSDPDTEFTVFAPTNAAFVTLATDLGFAGDTGDLDAVTAFLTGLGADTLETVVTYHVLGGTVTAGDLTSGPLAAQGTVTTLQGGTIDISELPVLGDKEPDLLDPSLLATDIFADNGVVHVIDRVLLPVDFPGNDAPSIADIVVETSSTEGFDDNGGDFDILLAALGEAGLVETFANPGDFTVFAPTDSGFVALSQGLGYDGSDEAGATAYLLDALRLLNGGEPAVDLLTTVLTYHVAGQSLQASQVLAADEIETLQGGTLSVDAGTLEIIDGDATSTPTIVATDLLASNGIVHVIDNVLLPVDLPRDGVNGVDIEIGTDGFDFIRTGRGDDLIDAKGGRDFVLAGSGDDLVLGGAGDDKILGGRGDDTLKGESGDDFLKGGNGDDILVGGAGNDKILTGRGHDTIVFSEGDGHDVVLDFWTRGDKIDLSSYGFESFDAVEDAISGFFGYARIELGEDSLTLLGTNPWRLDADDFIL